MLLNCYKSGKVKKLKDLEEEKNGTVLALDNNDNEMDISGTKKKSSRVLLPIMIKQYEDILEVECRNYNVYDKRFLGEKKIRIIW